MLSGLATPWQFLSTPPVPLTVLEFHAMFTWLQKIIVIVLAFVSLYPLPVSHAYTLNRRVLDSLCTSWLDDFDKLFQVATRVLHGDIGEWHLVWVFCAVRSFNTIQYQVLWFNYYHSWVIFFLSMNWLLVLAIIQKLSASFTISVGEEASHNIYSYNEVNIFDFSHWTVAVA